MIYAIVKVEPDSAEKLLNASAGDGWEVVQLSLAENWALLKKAPPLPPAAAVPTKAEPPARHVPGQLVAVEVPLGAFGTYGGVALSAAGGLFALLGVLKIASPWTACAAVLCVAAYGVWLALRVDDLDRPTT